MCSRPGAAAEAGTKGVACEVEATVVTRAGKGVTVAGNGVAPTAGRARVVVPEDTEGKASEEEGVGWGWGWGCVRNAERGVSGGASEEALKIRSTTILVITGSFCGK